MTDLQTAINSALRAAAESHGIDPEQIEPLIPAAWSNLCAQLGTRCVYIPKPTKTERNAAICAAWKAGETLAAIASEHRLTSGRIRQILVAAGELER